MSEIAQALKPFAAFAEHAVENVDGTWVWRNSQNERLCDWFGPSDFGAALSSAAVVKREPVVAAWQFKHYDPISGHPVWKTTLYWNGNRATEYRPLYLDPPPTSELEAENERLRERVEMLETDFRNACEYAAKAEDRLAEALKALEPFAAIEWADEDGWSNDSPYRERVCDWFGPSDFRAARRVREGGKVDG